MELFVEGDYVSFYMGEILYNFRRGIVGEIGKNCGIIGNCRSCNIVEGGFCRSCNTVEGEREIFVEFYNTIEGEWKRVRGFL